jgi:hypothetical protein
MVISLLRSTMTGFLAAGMVAGTVVLSAQAQTPTPNPSPSPSPPPTLRDRTSELWQEHQLTLILAGILTGSALLTDLGEVDETRKQISLSMRSGGE